MCLTEQLTLTDQKIITKLCNGFTILYKRFDGKCWHLLLKQTDKRKITEENWRFEYYQQFQRHGEFNPISSFRLMQEVSAIKRVKDEALQATINHEEIAKNNPAEWEKFLAL
jgi:hypothetical protein